MQQVSDIKFVGQGYDYRLTKARSLNVRPEIHPTTKQVMLVSRPGRILFKIIGANPQALWSMNNHLMAVNNNVVYRVSSTSAVTQIGTVQGAGRFNVSHDGTTALLSTPIKDYRVRVGGVVEVTDEDILSGNQNTYHNGYWLKFNGNEFISSAIDDPLTWVNTDNAFERQLPGDIVQVLSDHAELLVIKSESMGFWFESGSTSGIPFDRVPQLVLHTGCAFPDTLVGSLDERVFFVGTQQGMPPYAYVLQGRQAQKISTQAVDRALADAVDPVGWRYGIDGHPHYIIHDAGNFTWAYDVATNAWHEWTLGNENSYDVVALERMWGRDLGMTSAGHIVEFKDTLFRDQGDAIICTRITEPLSFQRRNMSVDWIEFDMQVGKGDAEVSLEMSWDRGRTWTNPRYKNIGPDGNSDITVKFDGLGSGQEFILRLKSSGNVAFVAAGARAGVRVARR